MSTSAVLAPDQWEHLLERQNEFTCYSAAVATWLAAAGEAWGRLVNTGLELTLTEAGDGRLGFAYFRAGLRADLQLVRVGADDPSAAIAGVDDELRRSGRVIIAGDGFRLPWHVAFGRHHLPHWFVLGDRGPGLEVADPFACRNELGVQQVTRHPVEVAALPELLAALPGDNAVHRLREVLALGDEAPAATEHRYQWFTHRPAPDCRAPRGAQGPAAVLRLARHFRERGQDLAAYEQADDIWSIARHRAFMLRYVRERAEQDRDGELTAWADQHGAPLVKRWGHTGPLLLQATLGLRAGRSASASVSETLESLAELERAAARAFPRASFDI